MTHLQLMQLCSFSFMLFNVHLESLLNIALLTFLESNLIVAASILNEDFLSQKHDASH